jgi:hypothetical protein
VTPERAMPISLRCARCGVEVRRGRDESYLVEIRAVADPSPPIFSEEDLSRDTETAIAELLGRIRNLTERQLIDQVYQRRLSCLCGHCYRLWVADPFGVSPVRSIT